MERESPAKLSRALIFCEGVNHEKVINKESYPRHKKKIYIKPQWLEIPESVSDQDGEDHNQGHDQQKGVLQAVGINQISDGRIEFPIILEHFRIQTKDDIGKNEIIDRRET